MCALSIDLGPLPENIGLHLHKVHGLRSGTLMR